MKVLETKLHVSYMDFVESYQKNKGKKVVIPVSWEVKFVTFQAVGWILSALWCRLVIDKPVADKGR